MIKNNYQLNLAKHGTHQIIGTLTGRAKTILDIGCNDGYLMKVHPTGQFTGIDYSAESAKIAKKNGYQKVFVGDLNQYSKFKLNKKFQVIIFADILEHLLQPQMVLRYFVDKNLEKNGRLIISLPNVANFTTRFALLFGKFNYTDSGILDRTHLHLYTKESASQLFIESGLKIVTVHFSSNNFGWIIEKFPVLGTLLGFNLIFVCRKS